MKKGELQELIGMLSFASTVVRPGCMFVRRLIDLSTTVSSKHHYVELSAEARADLVWWHEYLGSWNGVAIIQNWLVSSPDIEFYTDASDLGFGCVFGSEWAYGSWETGWAGTSINNREAFAIWVAINAWEKRLRNSQVVIHTDSYVNTQTWKKGSCRDPGVMRMIRPLFTRLV